MNNRLEAATVAERQNHQENQRQHHPVATRELASELDQSRNENYSEDSQSCLRIAYLVSRFPKLTETFVLYEMLALEEQGIEVDLYPLQREHTQVIHAEAMPFVEKAHFHAFMSWPIVRAQFHFLLRKPRVYLQTLWTLLRANWGSARMFFAALVFFPKIVLFARQMAAVGTTHIHAHFASHPAAAAFVIQRLTGIPYSFTAHGSDLHRDQHMLLEKVAEAAFVTAISTYNKRMIVSTCNDQFSDKIDVIHCGIDTNVFLPRTGPTLYEQGQGPFQILCIGTLHEVKGQTYLIDACRLIKERGIDFRCHFVGGGPDLAALTKQVRQAGLDEQVKFHNRLTRAGVAALLGRVDVVVTPSVPSRDGRREGIPVVLMEAMGCELPVIASDLSGIPELVEDGKSGMLIAPRDVHALAANLERLYFDSPLRHRLGKAGRAKVMLEFDLHRNAGLLAQSFSRKAG